MHPTSDRHAVNSGGILSALPCFYLFYEGHLVAKGEDKGFDIRCSNSHSQNAYELDKIRVAIAIWRRGWDSRQTT